MAELSNYKVVMLKNGTKLFYLSNEEIKKLFLKNELEKTCDSLSDLIPGIYEGGLKVWEGAIDLCNFIAEHPDQVHEATVLELGCGAALPSIFSMQLGAKSAMLQDFNDYVLECFTKPNFALNNIKGKCTFISGDWSCCVDKFTPKSFDLILTSETLYNTGKYEELHQLMDYALAPNGSILIATKIFYFGVGGSLPEWEEFIGHKNIFKMEQVAESTSSIPRKILKLTRK